MGELGSCGISRQIPIRPPINNWDQFQSKIPITFKIDPKNINQFCLDQYGSPNPIRIWDFFAIPNIYSYDIHKTTLSNKHWLGVKQQHKKKLFELYKSKKQENGIFFLFYIIIIIVKKIIGTILNDMC